MLDKHAPVKTQTIVMRPQVPCYTDEIRQAKGERRKAERRWRLSKLDSDLAVFKIKLNGSTQYAGTWGKGVQVVPIVFIRAQSEDISSWVSVEEV